jgi:diaminohydroxyphosphoribosylaminopyrimidine deaminase/5-amino-6-(5-phosphoribosylamino)uracil reductase
VDAQVARTVIGCLDPYPPVRGRGIAILRRAGIRTEVGQLEDECRLVNEGFITRVTRGRPFTILKLAISLDGRIAVAGGDSKWISSEDSRKIVHQWRNEADVVMVGAGTVIADDPRLTCRIEGGRDPVRVVIDGKLRCPPGAKIFDQSSSAPTIIVTSQLNCARVARRYGSAVEAIGVPLRSSLLDLADTMRRLAGRGWSKVLVEGGAHLGGAMLRAGVVDRVAFFVAPRIIGAGLPAIEGLETATIRRGIRLGELKARSVGSDWLLEAEVIHRGARRPRR